MLDIEGLNDLIANSFFSGDTSIAGMVLFIIAILIIVSVVRRVQTALIIAIPTSFVFMTMGLITNDMMMLIVIVMVLFVAFTAKVAWS